MGVALFAFLKQNSKARINSSVVSKRFTHISLEFILEAGFDRGFYRDASRRSNVQQMFSQSLQSLYPRAPRSISPDYFNRPTDLEGCRNFARRKPLVLG